MCLARAPLVWKYSRFSTEVDRLRVSLRGVMKYSSVSVKPLFHSTRHPMACFMPFQASLIAFCFSLSKSFPWAASPPRPRLRALDSELSRIAARLP